MDWTSYLPPTFQIGDVWWILAVCVAVVTVFKTFPPNGQLPWKVELGTLLVASLFSLGLIGVRAGVVYALGTALICSTSFYSAIRSALESFLSSKLGVRLDDNALLPIRNSSPAVVSTPKTDPIDK